MFKVGDKVRRIQNSIDTMQIGDVFTVTDVRGMWLGFNLNGRETGLAYHAENFELVKISPHPHRDVMIAMANGEEVQVFDEELEVWMDAQYPMFHPDFKYRIKPKAPIVEYALFQLNRNSAGQFVEFTYDPESMVLTDVKILTSEKDVVVYRETIPTVTFNDE